MDVLDSILHLIEGVVFMANALSCSTPYHAKFVGPSLNSQNQLFSARWELQWWQEQKPMFLWCVKYLPADGCEFMYFTVQVL